MATYITADGERKTALEWSRDPRCRVCLMTLVKRIRSGWDPQDAVTKYSTARADRHRIIVGAFGESRPLTDWEADERMVVSAETFVNRLADGWEAERALSTPSNAEKPKARSPQKLYHGQPLTYWLKDPRCRVSRATLLRNFDMDIPLDQALQFRMQPRTDERDLRADTVQKALELLKSGGEIWHYQEKDRNRISLILGNHRYEMDHKTLSDLTREDHVDERFSSAGLKMYQLNR